MSPSVKERHVMEYEYAKLLCLAAYCSPKNHSLFAPAASRSSSCLAKWIPHQAYPLFTLLSSASWLLPLHHYGHLPCWSSQLFSRAACLSCFTNAIMLKADGGELLLFVNRWYRSVHSQNLIIAYIVLYLRLYRQFLRHGDLPEAMKCRDVDLKEGYWVNGRGMALFSSIM